MRGGREILGIFTVGWILCLSFAAVIKLDIICVYFAINPDPQWRPAFQSSWRPQRKPFRHWRSSSTSPTASRTRSSSWGFAHWPNSGSTVNLKMKFAVSSLTASSRLWARASRAFKQLAFDLPGRHANPCWNRSRPWHLSRHHQRRRSNFCLLQSWMPWKKHSTSDTTSNRLQPNSRGIGSSPRWWSHLDVVNSRSLIFGVCAPWFIRGRMGPRKDAWPRTSSSMRRTRTSRLPAIGWTIWTSSKRISMRLPSQGSNLWHLHQPRQRRWQPAQRHIFGFHLTSCSRTSSDARKWSAVCRKTSDWAFWCTLTPRSGQYGRLGWLEVQLLDPSSRASCGSARRCGLLAPLCSRRRIPVGPPILLRYLVENLSQAPSLGWLDLWGTAHSCVLTTSLVDAAIATVQRASIAAGSSRRVGECAAAGSMLVTDALMIAKVEKKAALPVGERRAMITSHSFMNLCKSSHWFLIVLNLHRDNQSWLLLDIFSGANAPLAKAFLWCKWLIITPIDLEVDPDFDVSRVDVRNAIHQHLPKVSLISGAMSCATKSRAREKAPGPPPLRSEESPRGLDTLTGSDLERVLADNFSSDYLLALQHWARYRGIACLRENPLRSLHWHDPVEQLVHSSHEWYDMDYDACVFLEARRKGQRIRHSLPELQQLPSLRCGHVHAEDEWKRTGMEFPTFAEAEYTPSLVFTLAVCATAWAIKHGYAVEAVPRLPPIQLSGDVRPLVQFPPQVLRSELMDVMGFHLGLKPPGVHSEFVPRREVAADRLSLGKTLEANEIYIGQGHFSHRWNPTMWSNPFKQGRHGNSIEIVLRYGQWVVDQDQLMGQLASLENCSLICDCAANKLCHGDILRALVWHEHRGHRGQGRATSQPSRTVALLAGGARIVKAIPLRFSQAEIVAAVTSLCVGIDMQGFRWPCIEDLINDEMVLCFRQSHQAEDWLGYDHGPVTVGPAERSIIALSGLQQLGAVSSSKALPPLIPFGLGADEHFRLSLEAQNHPTPFEEFGIVDKDLQFAADELSRHGLKLRAMRQHVVKWVQELGRRWQPVTDRLRRSQAKGPRAATQGRHLALIALLMILIGWPDPGFLACLLGGFPSVGYSPPLEVYQQQPATFITLEEVLQDGFMDASALLTTVLPSEFDEEIVKAGNEDEAKGFCASPMSWEELLQPSTSISTYSPFLYPSAQWEAACHRRRECRKTVGVQQRLEQAWPLFSTSAWAARTTSLGSGSFLSRWGRSFGFGFGVGGWGPSRRIQACAHETGWGMGSRGCILRSSERGTFLQALLWGVVRAPSCSHIVQPLPTLLSSMPASVGTSHGCIILRWLDHPGLWGPSWKCPVVCYSAGFMPRFSFCGKQTPEDGTIGGLLGPWSQCWACHSTRCSSLLGPATTFTESAGHDQRSLG